MAFRRKFEVICDYGNGGNQLCAKEGSVMAISKEDANHKLVVLGWHYYDKGQSCIHYCPTHAGKP